MKAKIKGTVATEIKAETTKTSPTKPVETPKENAAAAKTGATVCASPAIAQATPNAPPCAFSGLFSEINVLIVTYWIPKPNENTAATTNIATMFVTMDKTTSPTTKKAMPEQSQS